MIAIVVVVRINQFKKVRQLNCLPFLLHLSLPQGILVVHLFLDKVMKDDCVLLLDELMALLEASRQEANVLKVLAIEHLDNEFKNFLVEIPYVQVVI